MLEQARGEAVLEVDRVLHLDQRRLVRIAGGVGEGQLAGEAVLLGVIVVLGVDLQAELVQRLGGEN